MARKSRQTSATVPSPREELAIDRQPLVGRSQVRRQLGRNGFDGADRFRQQMNFALSQLVHHVCKIKERLARILTGP